MPEIVQVDPARLKQLEGFEAVLNKIGNDKDARALFLQARKKIDPNAVIPEIDAAAPVNAAIETISKKIDTFLEGQAKAEAARKEREAVDSFNSNWESTKRAVQDREGYFDETIKEIEKLAQERQLPDFEAAAALWDKNHPPQTLATPSGFGPWGMFGNAGSADTEAHQKAMKTLIETHGEDQGVLSNLIQMGLAEARGQRFAA